MNDHPTLLNMPPWIGWPEVRILPLPVEAYVVRQKAPDWFEVRERDSGEMIYSGIGPVEVVRSPAPF